MKKGCNRDEAKNVPGGIVDPLRFRYTKQGHKTVAAAVFFRGNSCRKIQKKVEGT